MRFGLIARVLSAIGHAGRVVLSERQVILRSHGRIAYLRVSRLSQVSLIVLIAGLSGWVGFATERYLRFDTVVAGKNAAIAQSERAYNGLLQELKNTQSRFETVTRALQANQEHLLGVIERNHSLRAELQTSEAERQQELDDTKRRMGKQLADVSSSLKTQIKDRESRLGGEIDFLQQSLAATEAKRESAVRQGKDYLNEIGSLRGRIVELDQTTKTLQESLGATEHKLTMTAAQHASSEAERNRLDRRVVDLEGKLSALRDDQTELLTRIVDATVSDIERTRHIIAATGLDTSTLMPDSNAAQGGPFVPIHKPDVTDDFDTIVANLHSQLDHWDSLRAIVRSLPLAAPLDQYYVSSPFGKRKDPINHRWAMHPGLDLGAPYRSPVYSPAPGRVLFAGWKGRFGRFIEIDHGSGIYTRYGHLREIAVKKGDTVSYRQKIGAVGSSGRSTGPHLHYEIEVNGKRIDPARFLNAGKHVFKGLYASD